MKCIIKFKIWTIVITTFLFSSCKTTQEVADLKEKLKNTRQLERVNRTGFRKEERISRYSRKKQHGRVRVFTYDFEKNKFICDDNLNKPACADCALNCAPPFEIDELDGIKIVFKNVNPFLYSVNLYELQGDQISNENLTENNWSRNLTLNFDPLSYLSIDRENLAFTTSEQALTLINQRYNAQSQLNELLSKHSIDNLNKIISSTGEDDILNLTTDKNLQSVVDQEKEVLSNLQNAQKSVASDNDKIKILNDKLSHLKDSIELIKDKLSPDQIKKITDPLESQVNSLKSDVTIQTSNVKDFTDKLIPLKSNVQGIITKIKNDANTQLSQINVIQSQIDNLSSQLRSKNGLTALEKHVRENMGSIQNKIEKLNRYVIFHNYLIYQVHLPENNYQELGRSIRETLNKVLHLNENEIMPSFMSIQNEINALLKNVDDGINELISLDTELTKAATTDKPYTSNSSTYTIAQTRLSVFEKTLSEFDGIKMIGQIDFMFSMITAENFTVNYETHTIAENADFVRYRAEFKPSILDNKFPQGVTPFNLEIPFQVRGGWKYDISSGFVLDIGLKDPSFYFDRTSDATGKTVTLRQNGDGGNVTPSIAAFLNGYRRTSSNVKVGGAFGLGLSNNARFRMYLGPSVILGRKERIVVTSGISFGAISRLADGYTIDQVLNNDSSLPSTVPTVVDKYQFGGYFGIGFNLTGKQNQSFLQNLKFK